MDFKTDTKGLNFVINTRHRKLWLIALIVALVSIAVYLPAVNNDFINWDDNQYIYQNPNLKAPDADFINWMFSTFYASNWHPLTWLSYGIDYALWGMNPTGYHLTNVLFHGLNVFLVVLLIGSLFMKASGSLDGQGLFASALVGVFFGLHPLHVESVAWATERKDVLYAFFWLLSLLAYISYATSGRFRFRALFYGLSLCSFALSLMSKPMAVTLPVVLLILDFYPLRRLGSKKDFLKVVLFEKFPFFLLSLISAVLTVLAQREGGAMELMRHLSLVDRLWGAVKAAGFYLAKTVLPLNLSPFYPMNPGTSVFTWEYLGALILFLCISILCLKFWKRLPVLISVWVFYIVTLLPTLSIIQVGEQAMADRFYVHSYSWAFNGSGRSGCENLEYRT